MNAPLGILMADITALKVDVIVNSADPKLLGTRGVDAAIHAAAGPNLLRECLTLGPCEVGEAIMTWGYRLRARRIIHTVGPVWNGGGEGEPALLASCYWKSMELARMHDLHSIAFPCIGTGAHGYPHEPAAAIAVRTVLAFLEQYPGTIEHIMYCCLTPADLAAYKKALAVRPQPALESPAK